MQRRALDSMRRYILSAGRTGTVFLTQLLNELSEVEASHEPPPSRWQMILANIRNDTGIGGPLLKVWFEHTRRRRFSGRGMKVELNPFLPALTDLLPEPGVETRVVHLVRDPETWAHSMTVFKASSRFRDVIDYIPFSKPYPSPRPAGWSHLSAGEKALWRWVWCNKRLGELEDSVAAYRVIKFEDLFGSDGDRRQAASAELCETLALNQSFPENFDVNPANRNPRPAGNVEIAPEAVRRICAELAEKYHYSV